jgi:hypothetical protein
MPSNNEDEHEGHVPQDLDGPIEHPGVSTELDGEPFPNTKSQSEDDVEKIQVPAQDLSTETQSTSISTDPQTVVVVPRSQRRGLLGRFCLLAEVERPHDYKNGTKWFITLIIAAAAVVAPMGSAIFYREL